MKSRFISISSVLASISIAACGVGPADEAELLDNGDAAIEALAGGVVKGYIVRFHDGVSVDSAVEDIKGAHGVGVTHRYRNVFAGANFLVPSDAVRDAIAADPRVASIDLDAPVSAWAKPAPTQPGQTAPTGYLRIGADVSPNEGAGVRVAIIDTGVDLTHPDLAASLDPTYGKDCVNESGAAMDDANGHGSHVAGTVAALNNSIGSIGIATAAKIVPVKVLNRRGSGSWSTIICGVDYVAANAGAIKVGNMSLGGTGTECSTSSCTKSSLQIAVENAVAKGVTLVVAAGNEGEDAALHVPAAYDAVITVSAYYNLEGTVAGDQGFPTYSNFGADVDIAAPGTYIYSTWKDGGYDTISGTSMASPHVAAAAAMYLSSHAGASPATVRSALINAGESGYKGQGSLHPERLLDVRSF